MGGLQLPKMLPPPTIFTHCPSLHDRRKASFWGIFACGGLFIFPVKYPDVGFLQSPHKPQPDPVPSSLYSQIIESQRLQTWPSWAPHCHNVSKSCESCLQQALSHFPRKDVCIPTTSPGIRANSDLRTISNFPSQCFIYNAERVGSGFPNTLGTQDVLTRTADLVSN